MSNVDLKSKSKCALVKKINKNPGTKMFGEALYLQVRLKVD